MNQHHHLVVDKMLKHNIQREITMEGIETDDNYEYEEKETHGYNTRSIYYNSTTFFECDIREYFGLIDIVLPKNMKQDNLQKYFVNKNMVFMIIETMCLALLMPLHIANRFAFVKNCIKYSDYSIIFDNGMKIIKIPQEWNTQQWSYVKLLRFYDILPEFELLSHEDIESKLDDTSSTNGYVSFDPHFLSSLCWNINM
jgi:hypothetical protein